MDGCVGVEVGGGGKGVLVDVGVGSAVVGAGRGVAGGSEVGVKNGVSVGGGGGVKVKVGANTIVVGLDVGVSGGSTSVGSSRTVKKMAITTVKTTTISVPAPITIR